MSDRGTRARMILQPPRQPGPDVVPRPGDVVLLTGRASVQFAAGRAIAFRVIRVDSRPTYSGWAWLTGYELDRHGAALRKREVFVQVDGLERLHPGR